MPLKAGIYDPYLDTLGGGERYCLTVAEILLKSGYQVDLFWSGDKSIIEKAISRFALDLRGLNLVKDIFNLPLRHLDFAEDNFQSIKQPIKKTNNFLTKFQITSKYQLIFYLSDGSLPFIFSRKKFLHLQVPFHYSQNPIQKIYTQIKANLFSGIIVNSQFTKKFIDQYLGRSSLVLYPPVDILKFKPSASKTNSIISVGRFDNILNAKKQDVLIQAFIKLIRSKPNFNWKLIFLGGSQLAVDKNSYLAYLQKLAANYPIDFVVNPNFDLLRQYYGQAKIYWHAAGYDVDESLHPESTEHFGMSVVEAMASGAVPVVVNKGGLTEIVTHQQNGLLWQDPDELVEQTKDLIESPQKLNTLFLSSLNHSQKFSKENFQKKFISILES